LKKKESAYAELNSQHDKLNEEIKDLSNEVATTELRKTIDNSRLTLEAILIDQNSKKETIKTAKLGEQLSNEEENVAATLYNQLSKEHLIAKSKQSQQASLIQNQNDQINSTLQKFHNFADSANKCKILSYRTAENQKWQSTNINLSYNIKRLSKKIEDLTKQINTFSAHNYMDNDTWKDLMGSYRETLIEQLTKKTKRRIHKYWRTSRYITS